MPWRVVLALLLAALGQLPGAGAAAPAERARSGEEWVYVTNEDDGTLSVLSARSLAVVKTIEVGRRPRGVRLAPDGRTVYVAVSGTPKCPPSVPDEVCAQRKSDPSKDGIAAIDPRAGRLLKTYPGGSDPEQFDITPDGRRLVVANEDAGLASLVDLGSAKVLRSVEVGKEPEGVRVSPDGRLALVTAESSNLVALLDAVDGTPRGRVPVGKRPRDIVFSRDGTTAYVSAELDAAVSVIDVPGRRVARTLRLPAGSLPMGLALAPDERLLYVAAGRAGTVCRVDPVTGELHGVVAVGRRPWGLGLSGDGKLLFSANGPSNDVTVIDTASFAIVRRVAAGRSPWGVAIGPALE